MSGMSVGGAEREGRVTGMGEAGGEHREDSREKKISEGPRQKK
jgi:hypothetical protein